MDWHRIIRTACCVLIAGALIAIAQTQIRALHTSTLQISKLIQTQQELIKINQAQAAALAVQNDKELAAVARTMRINGFSVQKILEGMYDFDFEKLKK